MYVRVWVWVRGDRRAMEEVRKGGWGEERMCCVCVYLEVVGSGGKRGGARAGIVVAVRVD